MIGAHLSGVVPEPILEGCKSG